MNVAKIARVMTLETSEIYERVAGCEEDVVARFQVDRLAKCRNIETSRNLDFETLESSSGAK